MNNSKENRTHHRGSTGIGLATAKRFVTEGAYVFITGRREAELPASVKEIGATVTGVQGDVLRTRRSRSPLRSKSSAKKGKLDIVFANAGGAQFAPLGKVTEDHFDALFKRQRERPPFHGTKALRSYRMAPRSS